MEKVCIFGAGSFGLIGAGAETARGGGNSRLESFGFGGGGDEFAVDIKAYAGFINGLSFDLLGQRSGFFDFFGRGGGFGFRTVARKSENERQRQCEHREGEQSHFMFFY